MVEWFPTNALESPNANEDTIRLLQEGTHDLVRFGNALFEITRLDESYLKDKAALVSGFVGNLRS